MARKLFAKLQNAINVLTGIQLAMIIAIIFMQVITRYVFFKSLPWSEELSRYIFVWLIVLGVNLPIRDGIEIKVDVIEDIVKGRARRYLHIFHYIAAFAAATALGVSSIHLVQVGTKAISASMHIPMYLIYVGIPVGMALAAIQIILKLIPLIAGKEES